MNFAIRCLGLRIRSHGLFIRSFKLHKSNSREQIAIWENGLSNSRERFAIRENGLSNLRERITNPGERITYPWERITQFDIPIYLRVFFLKISMSLRTFVKEVLRKFSDIIIESSKNRLTNFWFLWYTLLIHFVWLSLFIHLYRFIKCIVHCIWW